MPNSREGVYIMKRNVLIIGLLLLLLSSCNTNKNSVVFKPEGRTTSFEAHYDDNGNLCAVTIDDKNFKFKCNMMEYGNCSYQIDTDNYREIVNTDVDNDQISRKLMINGKVVEAVNQKY